MKRLLIIPCLALLAGCVSHMTREQCLNTNWQAVGVEDGSNGRQPRDLRRAIEDCDKFKVPVSTHNYQTGWHIGAQKFCTPDSNIGYQDGTHGQPESLIYSRTAFCESAQLKLNLSQYKVGRAKGLQAFCTYDNGLNLARQGQSLPDVCPAALADKFAAGWRKGANKFCNDPANAFAYGKDNKPYPSLCSAALYPAFKSEYDRGFAIGQRLNDINGRLDALNHDIDDIAMRYSLERTGSGYYEIGFDKSDQARDAVHQVNDMVREKHRLEGQLFNTQVLK